MYIFCSYMLMSSGIFIIFVMLAICCRKYMKLDIWTYINWSCPLKTPGNLNPTGWSLGYASNDPTYQPTNQHGCFYRNIYWLNHMKAYNHMEKYETITHLKIACLIQTLTFITCLNQALTFKTCLNQTLTFIACLNLGLTFITCLNQGLNFMTCLNQTLTL
jgi:hypothetical protein